MARYVILEFDDNGEAQAFIDTVNSIAQEQSPAMVMPFSGRLAGIFAKPGRTCNCLDARHRNYRDPDKARKRALIGAVVEGPKFGWWVCTECKRPRKAGHQLVNLLDIATQPEGPSFDGVEMTVASLDVTGVYRSQIGRKKRFRNKGMRQ